MRVSSEEITNLNKLLISLIKIMRALLALELGLGFALEFDKITNAPKRCNLLVDLMFCSSHVFMSLFHSVP